MEVLVGVILFAALSLVISLIAGPAALKIRFDLAEEGKLLAAEAVAEELGFTRSRDLLSGKINGITIELSLKRDPGSAIDILSDGDSQLILYELQCTAELDPPLRMGVEVIPKRGFFGRASDGLEQQIGSQFAAEFRASAAQPELAQALLKGFIGSRLARANLAGLSPHVTDRTLRCSHTSSVPQEQVRRLVQNTASLAQEMLAARARMQPFEREKRIANRWGELAAELGGTFDVQRYRMRAKLDGYRLRASLAARSGRWRTRLDVLPPTAFADDLLIVGKPRSESRAHSQSVDAQSAFDAAFVVKVQGTVRPVLTGSVCAALLALRQEVDCVRLQTKRLRVQIDGEVTDVARLRRVVALLSAVVEALEHSAPRRGPYR